MSPTATAAVNVTVIPNTGKFLKLAGIWENATDFPSETYAAQMDKLMLHILTAAHGAGVKLINPNCTTLMYSLPLIAALADDGTQPWHADFLAAMSESWVLHNPDGDLGTATRCAYAGPPASNVIDPRTAASNTFWGNEMVKFMKGQLPGATWTGGIDRLFHDGPNLTGGIAAYSTPNGNIDGWTRLPVLAVQQNWYGTASGGVNPSILAPFFNAIHTTLKSNGFQGLEINCVQDAPSFWGTAWVDGHVVQDANSAGVWSEFQFRGSNMSDWKTQLTRINEAITAGVDFVGIFGLPVSAGGTGEYSGLASAAAASILLYTDGQHGYFAWTDNGFRQNVLSYVQGVNQIILRPNINDGNNGLVFSPDGSNFLLQRNYLRMGGGLDVVVKLNIDPNGITRGGLLPAHGSIDGVESIGF